MTHPLANLLENNRTWSASIAAEKPGFFETLSKQQNPDYLWIGCSDSRVPANEIVGLLPGELFVHRNVGNLVRHTDLNCLSVIQFAVDVLKVKHIIVCGHYGCGAVQASLLNQRVGLADNWLGNIKHIRRVNHAELDDIADEKERVNRLCEMNVLEQVKNVCHTTVIQDAWTREQPLTVHGWVYSLKDGLVKDLAISISDQTELDGFDPV